VCQATIRELLVDELLVNWMGGMVAEMLWLSF